MCQIRLLLYNSKTKTQSLFCQIYEKSYYMPSYLSTQLSSLAVQTTVSVSEEVRLINCSQFHSVKDVVYFTP